MAFGDVASIVFVVAILASLAMSFSRGGATRRMQSGGHAAQGGPRDFAQSGGYQPDSDPLEVAVPLSAVQSHRIDYEPGEPVPRSRGEARLTREEMLERGPSNATRPSEEERTQRRPIAAPKKRMQGTARARKIREQLGSRESVQMAYLMKEVLDRPIGMRDGA